ncbi:hypothetical protein KCP76_17305 [Salmonella enterica subsp. enterica serovar Weltevreden]|nr:hypothetical protein KCP76_17305 [Salmonella enterica subsp. enterica serovar Weltevreden]
MPCTVWKCALSPNASSHSLFISLTKHPGYRRRNQLIATGVITGLQDYVPRIN